MGGTYVDSNVVSISVTQHAMWHFANWQLWGKEEDWIAWRGLGGVIGKEEVILEVLRMGGRRSGLKTGKSGGTNNVGSILKHPETLKNRSDQGKKNGAENGRKGSKPVTCTESGESYPSIREASRSTGIHYGHISQSCRTGCRAGGFHWQFAS
jgi:hypothetical protein